MQLAGLKPAEYNPRKQLQPGDAAYEKLKQSILRYGNVEPIVWNKTTGNVVGGHQRIQVLQDLGVEESEVSVVELTPQDEKALNVALNKIEGEWDDEKLVVLLEDITATGGDVSITGFDNDELTALFGQLVSEKSKDPVSEANSKRPFNYQEQYGVIIICKDESEQEQVYTVLVAQGYECRVVAT